jgi:hypothetical protein
MNLEMQRQLLGDPVRNEAFARAIANTVRPGDRVIDLGAGTGYLGFLALQAGAGKVVFIEENGILGAAVHMAEQLGVSHRCEFYEFHSSQLKFTQKASVIICETLGSFAFEEHLIENWRDAERWASPSTRWLPSSVEVFVGCVIGLEFHKTIDIWSGIPGSLPWNTLRHVSLSRPYAQRIPADTLLKPCPSLIRVCPTQTLSSRWESRAEWILPQDTEIFGFCLFWEAKLDKTEILSTSPKHASTHWKQLYLPLESSLEANSGDRVVFEIRSETGWESGLDLEWTGLLSRQSKTIQKTKMKSKEGYPDWLVMDDQNLEEPP